MERCQKVSVKLKRFHKGSSLMRSIFLLANVAILFFNYGAYAATCTGSANCQACSTCRYCKHCAQNGGTCSVCGGGTSSGALSNSSSKGQNNGLPWWVIIGGAVVVFYVIPVAFAKYSGKHKK